jgi:hypothetical protein
MNFKQFLSEMPMQMNLVGNNWQTTPDQPTVGNFDVASSKMISSDKARAKIVRRMHRVPHDFNVYFVQTKNKIPASKVPIRIMSHMYEEMGISPEEAPIIPGKINMFVTSWELDPPTSWMIVHRFAHADGELTNLVQREIVATGKKMSRRLDDYGLVLNFGTMKSAVTGQIGGADEPSHEVITQHIMTGKVTFDPKRKSWANQRDAELLQQLEIQLDQIIQQHMQQAANFVYFLF